MERVLDRTFEALIFDWDGTAVPDRKASALEVRSRLERLSERGVHVAIVTGTHVGNVDGQLAARPKGPGKLWLCVNRGSEVFEVGEQGPELLHRLEASLEQETLLNGAAQRTVECLADAGIAARVVSQRLNRRKIDLIPEPDWADPPKARIRELLEAVSARLARSKLASLKNVVALALEVSRDVGLIDARVTTDVKHVEIGLTDKSDSARWVVDRLDGLGIGLGLILVLGDEFGPLGGVPGSDSLMLVSPRLRALSVGAEPEGVPEGVLHLAGGPERFVKLIDEQLARRAARRVPNIDDDGPFCVEVPPLPPRVQGTLLTIADGILGTRIFSPGTVPKTTVVAAGIYEGEDSRLPPRLAVLPTWADLESVSSALTTFTLDLRTGLLAQECPDQWRAVYFSSLAEPGRVAMRAEWHPRVTELVPGESPRGSVPEKLDGERSVVVTVHQSERADEATRTLQRLGYYAFDGPRSSTTLADEDGAEFERLLSEQRARWHERWAEADIEILGDDRLTRDIRFALFHLMSSVVDAGEAIVGARGLSGEGYNGHVFWDAEVFVLPFLAATHPSAARAMLTYRARRLGAAKEAAERLGRAGARFGWESAMSGFDVTPRVVIGSLGEERIFTGDEEEHIVADVAWAVDVYLRWSGDESFAREDGRRLLLETARYWASRVSIESDGRGHIRRVIGPDEYHEHVDDNAFTNVMARWNLRRAASLLDERTEDRDEASRLAEIANLLVDGFDATSGIYEQFEGFRNLEPLLISQLATTPVAADLLLGRERVRGAQVLKQADVLMLHHMVPFEVAANSLRKNLDYYLPRTAHGSSLSPAIHAALLARAGDPERALEWLRLACRIDLDDLTHTTASGLHLATMGGVWQAIVYGFLGARPTPDGVLELSPNLPAQWEGVRVHLVLRNVAISVEVLRDSVEVMPKEAIVVCLPGLRSAVPVNGARFLRTEHGFRCEAACPTS